MNWEHSLGCRNLDAIFFSEGNQVVKCAIQMLKEFSPSDRAAIAIASGIEDSILLVELEETGIPMETLTALRVVPLVAVAWSYGELSLKQRNALLTAVLEVTSLDWRGPVYYMLEQWLDELPNYYLTAAWKAFVGVLCTRLNGTVRDRLRLELIGCAQHFALVAERRLVEHGSPSALQELFEDYQNAFLMEGDGVRVDCIERE